jgi:predicted RNA-binding Zn ribbon-like protein
MDELADRLPPLIGGAVCLDLVNTVDPGVARATDRDHLGGTYAGLVSWASYAGVITEPQGVELRRLASRDDGAAARAYRRAVRLREGVFGTFHSLATGAEPNDRLLGEIRDRYAAAVSAASLTPQDGNGEGWQWRWADEPGSPGDLDLPTHVFAASAVDLLTGGRTDRVRACAGDGCGWLFLDRSRNGSRRWCLMRYCGNVGKSARQAAVRRAARRTAARTRR